MNSAVLSGHHLEDRDLTFEQSEEGRRLTLEDEPFVWTNADVGSARG